MSRGIIDAQTLRSEQFEFEARSSDPADAQPGEYWIRVDQTSSNPDVIAELRRQDTSGVTTAPIFASAEESNLGTDVVRGPSVVLADGSVGFVAMTTGDGAVGSPRAVNAAGTLYVSHDALELNPIPDSVVPRPDDDNTASFSNARGVRIDTSQEWPEFYGEISSLGSGYTRAYIYRVSDGQLLDDIDVSSNSAGDVIKWPNAGLSANETYNVVMDAEGGSWTAAAYTGTKNIPYESSDGYLKIIDGAVNAQSTTGGLFSFKRLGNLS